MEYKVTNVKGVFDSKYPDSKRYVFTVEGYQNELSAFSKFSIEAGQTINGDIEINGQYHNFKFGSKKTAGMSQDDKDMLQKIYREVYACRQAIVMLNQIFQEKGMLPKSDYPESNGATAFDDPEDAGIDPADVPFN